MSKDQKEALKLLERAADHLEAAAECISYMGDVDEEDAEAEAEFIAEIREFLGKGSVVTMTHAEAHELASNWLSTNSNDESYIDATSNRLKNDLAELLLKLYEQGAHDAYLETE